MKLPNLIVVLLAILPLTACAKSQEEMCAEFGKHAIRLAVLEGAPLNASKEMIDLRVEQLVSRPSFEISNNKCVNNEKDRVTKKEFECAMKAKTLHALNACGK